MSEYKPGTYVKGDSVRVAHTAATAVALRFDGYQLRTEDALADVDYRDLQAQAKAAGISANQSRADLTAALAAYDAEQAEKDSEGDDSALGVTPELEDGDSPLDSTDTTTIDES